MKIKGNDGSKTFINICTSPEIPPPEDISNENLMELCMNDDFSYVIPMSIGHEKLETDKGGLMNFLTLSFPINNFFILSQEALQFLRTMS